MKIEDAFYKLNADNKVELHFDGRNAYSKLPDEVKKDIKQAFIWGRQRGAWVSRAKGVGIPWQMKNYEIPFQGADELNTFDDMQERKLQRLENKADRFETRADKRESVAKSMQAEFNKMRGDWSWLTQPNINSSRGRSFTNSRNKIFDRYDKGMRLSINADKLRDAADEMRGRASQGELESEKYLLNRLKDGEKAVRRFEKFQQSYAEKLKEIDSQPQDWQVWLMARMRDYELEFQKLAYFRHHFDVLQQKKGEKGEATHDDVEKRLKGFSKEVKDHFKQNYGITFTTVSKQFGAGRRSFYFARADKDLPEKFQTRNNAKNILEGRFSELAALIDLDKKPYFDPNNAAHQAKMQEVQSEIDLTKQAMDQITYSQWEQDIINFLADTPGTGYDYSSATGLVMANDFKLSQAWAKGLSAADAAKSLITIIAPKAPEPPAPVMKIAHVAPEVKSTLEFIGNWQEKILGHLQMEIGVDRSDAQGMLLAKNAELTEAYNAGTSARDAFDAVWQKTKAGTAAKSTGYKFEGAKYLHTEKLNLKEIAKLIRKDLSTAFPGMSWSVRMRNYNALTVQGSKYPKNPFSHAFLKKVAEGYTDDTIWREFSGRHYDVFNDEFKAAKDKAEAIVQQYNYDDSDSMTDYFNVRFYGHAEIDTKDWRDKVFADSPETQESPTSAEAFGKLIHEGVKEYGWTVHWNIDKNAFEVWNTKSVVVMEIPLPKGNKYRIEDANSGNLLLSGNASITLAVDKVAKERFYARPLVEPAGDSHRAPEGWKKGDTLRKKWKEFGMSEVTFIEMDAEMVAKVQDGAQERFMSINTLEKVESNPPTDSPEKIKARALAVAMAMKYKYAAK